MPDRHSQWGWTRHGAGRLTGSALLTSVDLHIHYIHHVDIAWQDGRIVSIEEKSGDPPGESTVVVPGFVDLHIHWPQSAVRGQFAGQLLPWLREAIWPAEAAFADLELARQRAGTFVRDALRAGTCAGLFFGPPFAPASLIFDQHAPLGWIEGPALMERNGPPELLGGAGGVLAALEAQHPARKQIFAVTPRFAPNLSEAGLDACAKVAERLKLPVQSHLSENMDEMRWVADLFGADRSYTDVYDRPGLLGPRSIFAHGIHLDDRELARLAQTGTTIAHCPTSNEALASGRMPLERLRRAGVPWVLATDVGAGPTLSLLDVMGACLAVQGDHAAISAGEALCRATAVPGQWLSQFDSRLRGLGTLQVGAPAHLVALPRSVAREPHAMIAAWLQGPRAALETLPLETWCWGNPCQSKIP